MAKQQNLNLVGRRGNIVYYELRGGYYMRTKSTLKGKRVKTDPAFRKTMENASVFGIASKMSTEIYRQLPPKKKKNRIDLAITSRAIKLIRTTGLEPAKAKEVLIKEFLY
jgi:hypothetical protein